eukprot:372974-Amphidinium_carterae.1
MWKSWTHTPTSGVLSRASVCHQIRFKSRGWMMNESYKVQWQGAQDASSSPLCFLKYLAVAEAKVQLSQRLSQADCASSYEPTFLPTLASVTIDVGFSLR